MIVRYRAEDLKHYKKSMLGSAWFVRRDMVGFNEISVSLWDATRRIVCKWCLYTLSIDTYVQKFKGAMLSHCHLCFSVFVSIWWEVYYIILFTALSLFVLCFFLRLRAGCFKGDFLSVCYSSRKVIPNIN